MQILRGKQKGFTLVEVLVVIPIIGLVGAAASAIILQIMQSGNIGADTLAVRYVQLAGDRVSLDGVQAQSASGISTGVGSGMPFTLTWGIWDTGASPPVNETHQVTYSLMNMPSGSQKRLVRREVVTDKDGVVTKDTTITVAESVDTSGTSCRWESGQKTFVFTVTVVIGDTTESRAYRVTPRPMG
jgi:prepilin-type N-terminal cleavage/methylation domain-containing protein